MALVMDIDRPKPLSLASMEDRMGLVLPFLPFTESDPDVTEL